MVYLNIFIIVLLCEQKFDTFDTFLFVDTLLHKHFFTSPPLTAMSKEDVNYKIYNFHRGFPPSISLSLLTLRKEISPIATVMKFYNFGRPSYYNFIIYLSALWRKMPLKEIKFLTIFKFHLFSISNMRLF